MCLIYFQKYHAGGTVRKSHFCKISPSPIRGRMEFFGEEMVMFWTGERCMLQKKRGGEGRGVKLAFSVFEFEFVCLSITCI